MKRRLALALGSATAMITALGVPSAQAAPGLPGEVLHVGQISRQDVAPQPGSEPDTLVEPDIAVSPVDENIAVAAAHDGRYPDGGAVDISYAWTHDGGAHWHHAPLPGITKPTGGKWDRASDPVVAFGPDGSVYISVLDITEACPSGVSVSRSTDGGKTFGAPMMVHESDSCAYSDDKNVLVVDTQRDSPHFGRLYQFWTPFLEDAQGNGNGSLQVVRWSDDKGRTWSPTVNLTEPGTYTQNSQPMIQPDGTIVDAYLDEGSSSGEEPEHPGVAVSRPHATPSAEPPADHVVARTSHDGGATWSGPSTVTNSAGEGPAGVRCCLFSATADALTGDLYASWISPASDAVMLTRSGDGAHWSPASPVIAQANHDYINTDVAARAGKVYVANSTRDLTDENGRYVQQQISISRNGGSRFAGPIEVGPLSDLTYAAQSRGAFPGDYMGSALGDRRYYSDWARSSTPPDPTATFHQTIWGAALRAR
jgi:hypothetical protein